MQSFAEYRTFVENTLRQVQRDFAARDLDEQAVPSYLHPNPLMAYLFWRRLDVVIKACRSAGVGKVLDFGCGAGVLFPFFQQESEKPFWACDVDLRAARKAAQLFPTPDVHFLNSADEVSCVPTESCDTITALDVLEHVADLDRIGEELYRVLKSSGQLIVSCPTESFFYRLGRKLAGFESHFHVRTAYDVERDLKSLFQARMIARLYPPFTLFRIVSYRKRAKQGA